MEQGKTIVIAGQDIQLTDFLTIELSKAFHHVYTAPDGEVGFHLAKTVHPDLTVVDSFMPRLDGLSTLKKIRETPETHDLKIALFTTSNEDVKSIEPVTVLRKDVSPEKIVDEIEKLLK
ncbi:response regulator [Candidatus Jorgensenbacteria bacterium]|nr:response regulator [Candidatus Jorgensenbacteria bacterium]